MGQQICHGEAVLKHAAIALAVLLVAGCAPIFSVRGCYTVRQLHGGSFRLAVRTSSSQGGNRGSSPLGSTIPGSSGLTVRTPPFQGGGGGFDSPEERQPREMAQMLPAGAWRGITADTALRLARFFGTTPQLWLNFQQGYELRKAEIRSAREINAAVKPRREAA